jgi:hypothetical protein
MYKGNVEHFVPKYTREQWEAIRSDIRRGQSIPQVAKKYGMPHTTIYSRAQREKWGIAEMRCIERGRRRLGKAPERRLYEALAKVEVKEVELELAENGERLRKCGVRTRVRIAEMVEVGLERLSGAVGLSEVCYSRALAALAAVGKIIHGWDREPVPEPMGAVNLPLMRMTPAQLRERSEEARRRRACFGVAEPGAGNEVVVCRASGALAAAQSQGVRAEAESKEDPAQEPPESDSGSKPEPEFDVDMANLMRGTEKVRQETLAREQEQARGTLGGKVPNPSALDLTTQAQKTPPGISPQSAPPDPPPATSQPNQAPRPAGPTQQDRWHAREETRLRMRENPFR